MIGQLMRGKASRISVFASVVAILAVGQSASAQFFSDFEAPLYVGSAGGTSITGQDGFYIPVADSLDGLVYTYAGNVLGIVQNPNGGSQFAGVTGVTGGPVPFARA